MDRVRLDPSIGACYRLDGPGVMATVDAGPPEEMLPLAGDGLQVPWRPARPALTRWTKPQART